MSTGVYIYVVINTYQIISTVQVRILVTDTYLPSRHRGSWLPFGIKPSGDLSTFTFPLFFPYFPYF